MPYTTISRLSCNSCGWTGEWGAAYAIRDGCPECGYKGPKLVVQTFRNG